MKNNWEGTQEFGFNLKGEKIINSRPKAVLCWELKEVDSRWVFSGEGGLGNGIDSPDQSVKEIYELFPDNAFVQEFYRIWSKHHLNDMHAGTEAQENAITEAVNSGSLEPNPSYEDTIAYLKKQNLYVDNGYKYGSSWLYRPIPKKDLDVIKSWEE